MLVYQKLLWALSYSNKRNHILYNRGILLMRAKFEVIKLKNAIQYLRSIQVVAWSQWMCWKKLFVEDSFIHSSSTLFLTYYSCAHWMLRFALKTDSTNEHGESRMPRKQTFEKQTVEFKQSDLIFLFSRISAISVQLPINPFCEIGLALCSKKKKKDPCLLQGLCICQGFLHNPNNAECLQMVQIKALF